MPRTFSRASASLVLAAVVAGWLSSAASAELESLPRFVDTDVEQDEILEVISSANSRSFKPVGHSSVVLRMRTVARVTAALKVRTREIQHGYRYEIAAYRIGRLLGLDNVTLLPHLGTAALDVRTTMGLMAVENLKAVLIDGAAPPNAVG